MQPREVEKQPLMDVRRKWWSNRNASEALMPFNPNYRCVERTLLEGFVKHGDTAYELALQMVS